MIAKQKSQGECDAWISGTLGLVDIRIQKNRRIEDKNSEKQKKGKKITGGGEDPRMFASFKQSRAAWSIHGLNGRAE